MFGVHFKSKWLKPLVCKCSNFRSHTNDVRSAKSFQGTKTLAYLLALVNSGVQPSIQSMSRSTVMNRAHHIIIFDSFFQGIFRTSCSSEIVPIANLFHGRSEVSSSHRSLELANPELIQSTHGVIYVASGCICGRQGKLCVHFGFTKSPEHTL